MALFGCGNPLLDIQIHTDSSFLKKYNLEANGFCFQNESQAGIHDEMRKKPNAIYIPGGATLNSLRIFQGLAKAYALTTTNTTSANDIGTPSTPPTGYSTSNSLVTYTGCIGNDEFGKLLCDLCKKEGVRCKFALSKRNTPTGVCGVSVVGAERSLCTRLGAANDFQESDLDSDSDVWKSGVERCLMAYSAGFFLTVCPKGMLKVAKHCANNNKIFCTNLSAPFIVQNFTQCLLDLLPFVDITFGAQQEYEALLPFLTSDPPSQEQSVAVSAPLMRRVAELLINYKKENSVKRPSRLIVITDGTLPTIVATRLSSDTKKVTFWEFPVTAIPPEKLIDTNAAGDAFVGGFLFGLLVSSKLYSTPLQLQVQDDPIYFTEETISLCIKFAHFAASHVIQKSGCTFDFQLDSPQSILPQLLPDDNIVTRARTKSFRAMSASIPCQEIPPSPL